MSAPFSRLQLAAALLEYDNDPENPDAPYRSAHESALFAHLRRNVRTPNAGARRSSNYVGVALPSETASMGGRDSVLDGRRSRGSTLALRNPFGGDEYLDEEDDDEHDERAPLDVDLASWGLDAFISKDKPGGAPASGPQPLSAVSARFPTHATAPAGTLPRTRTTRSLSVGNFEHLLPDHDDGHRRKSIADPLDVAAANEHVAFTRRRAASYSLDAAPTGPAVVQSIPFPSRSVRSPSPPLDEAGRPRSYSSATAMDGPARARSNSNGTMTSRMLSDNPFALEPPSRASRFDPKAAAHARTLSNASMGTRLAYNDDNASVMTGRGLQASRPMSTIDLLRPKVLVMPSPLQPLNTPAPAEPTRDGFQITTDGPPLPPGARSVRDRQYNAVPIASNSFTPNPRMNLSLSQLTFRSTLKVDDRGASYSDLAELPRATEEGEQINLDPTIPEDLPVGDLPDEFAQPGRPPGKLFGKSLIDDLEARKANMRSKQRVFRGDDRPSMMARGQLNRSSTLIDPASLPARPPNQRMSSNLSQQISRPVSAAAGPLLDFEGDRRMEGKLAPPTRPGYNARSVFGVDTLWEREMVKLKAMEEQEAQERLEQEEREANLPPKRKKKGKKGAVESQPPSPMSQLHRSTSQLSSPPIVTSSSPPVLPMPSPVIHGPPPVVADDESDSENSDAAPTPAAPKKPTDWHSDSDSDGEQGQGPRRTTGVGLRYPKQRAPSHPPQPPADDESDDDIPLSAAMLRVPRRRNRDSDSDEDKPLSVLIRKSQSASVLNFPAQSSSSMLNIDFDRPGGGGGGGDGDEDEDEAPLGLRASRVAPSIHAPSFVGGGEEDDDMPLGLQQQRRSQFPMMSMAQQQQQQQQQMMMMQAQAQAQAQMFMNPSMMGSGFFPPPPMPMQMPMMMPPGPPMQIPSPPPQPDPGKFGLVDRWRRDVAVEGD